MGKGQGREGHTDRAPAAEPTASGQCRGEGRAMAAVSLTSDHDEEQESPAQRGGRGPETALLPGNKAHRE